MAERIARLGLIAAVLIFVVLVIRFALIAYANSMPLEWHMVSVVVKYFITSVTIVVVAVPEGKE